MKLEQQMYEISRIRKERIYTIGNLENLSATALYYGEGGGSSGFSGGIGGGSFGGIGKKECNKYGIVKTPLMEDNGLLHQDFSNLPIYSTPSKIFIPEVKTPLLRYDPADKIHSSGHLHIGNGPAFKIGEEESVKIFIEAWFRNNK